MGLFSEKLGIYKIPTYNIDVGGTVATDAISSDIGYNINQVTDPTAPTGVVSAGGSVDTGAHWYGVTFYTAIGETHVTYTASQITTTAGNNTVTLTIPTSTDTRVIGRKIYRTKAGQSQFQEYLLATVANNTATSYVDTAADSSLSGSSGIVYFKVNTTSNNVTINGVKSLTLDSKGTYIGYNSGNSVTTGGRLVFIGQTAGQNNTSGFDNTYIGHNSGTGNTSGIENTAFGSYSLTNNILRNYNTAIGAFSLINLTTGGSVTAVGNRSGQYISDGTTPLTSATNSIFIGNSTKASANGNSNEIVIGYNAIGLGSNISVIGNSSTTLHKIYGSSDITRGNFQYHRQTANTNTTGDWRTYADANGFYTDYYDGANWVNKHTVSV